MAMHRCMCVTFTRLCQYTYVHLWGQEQPSLFCANKRLIVYLQSSVIQQLIAKLCKCNEATENASTENESTGGWNMQVRKTLVRIYKGGKRKYSNLKSISKSLRFSSLAVLVDLLSVFLSAMYWHTNRLQFPLSRVSRAISTTVRFYN